MRLICSGAIWQRHKTAKEKTRHGLDGGSGAAAGFYDYSTQQGPPISSYIFLPKLGDDAFRVIAHLALESAKVMVHLEWQNANHPHGCAARRARRL